MSEWFVVQNDEERGPFSWSILKAMAVTGELDPLDELRQDGKEKTRQACEVREVLKLRKRNFDGDWLIPRWHVLKLADQRGPYLPEVLRQYVSYTNPMISDLLRRFDKADWRKVAQVRDLFSAFGNPISPEAKWDEDHQLEPSLPWYVLKQKNKRGPFTTDQMIELTANGDLGPDDLVEHPEGAFRWQPARCFPFHDKQQLLASFKAFQRAKSEPQPEAKPRQPVRRLDLSIALACMAFSKDGRWQLTADLQHRISVCDKDNPYHFNSLQGEPEVTDPRFGTSSPPTSHSEIITGLALSPDNQTAASCSRDGTVRIWNTERCQLQFSRRSDRRSVNAIAFLDDGKVLASCGDDGVIRVWDVATGKLKSRIRTGSKLLDLCISPLSVTQVFTVGHGKLRLWNIESKKPLIEYNTPWLHRIAVSGSCKRLAAAGLGRLYFWRLDDDLMPSDFWWTPCEGRTLCLRFPPSGDYLVSAGSRPEIKIWDVENRECFDWHDKQLKGAVHDLAFQRTAEQRLLVTAGEDGLLRWDFSEWQD